MPPPCTFIFVIGLAGTASACVLESDGLGLGDRPEPKMEPKQGVVQALAGGWMSACFLDSDAQVACWGSVGGVDVGQPQFVPALQGSRHIAAAYPRACGSKPGGVVDCTVVDGVEGARPAAARLSVGFDIAEMTMSEFGIIVVRGVDGQLVFERVVPEEPTELATVRRLPNIKSLGGGGTCAISDDDRLWCWEREGPNPLAIQVPSIQNILWFTRFNDVALTLTTNGDVWTIPVGPNAIDTSTRRVHQIPGASRIDASVSQACVTTEQAVKCWTLTYGGGGSTTEHGEPATIADSADAVELAVGLNHACLLTAAGAVRCWGSNGQGQLGQGTLGDKTFDQAIAVLSNATEVSVGDRFSCAVAGGLHCWGVNDKGQLGLGNTGLQPRPAAIPNSLGLASVRAGWESACAIRETDGAVLCWGGNEEGSVGVRGSDRVTIPTEVGTLQAVTALEVGALRACAVEAGRLWCWGKDEVGRFGRPAGGTRAPTPRAIPINREVVDVVIGSRHTCAIDVDRTLWCWGQNRRGESGGPDEQTFVPFPLGQNVIQVAVENSITCFEVEGEGFSCVGIEGAAVHESMLRMLSPVTDVSLSSSSCARKTDGAVWCWPSLPGAEATQVLSEVTQLSSGNHSCWVDRAGHVRCAGDSYSGQLGDGEHRSDAAVEVLEPR